MDATVFVLFLILTALHASDPALQDRLLLAFGVALTTHLLRGWR